MLLTPLDFPIQLSVASSLMHLNLLGVFEQECEIERGLCYDESLRSSPGFVRGDILQGT
jgi:hypothetical protein